MLALVVAAGLVGPLLAAKQSWRLPVVLCELAAGLLLGRTGLGVVDPDNRTLAFLADIGFALVMFVAGSHVPLRNVRLRSFVNKALLRVLLVAAAAAALGIGIAVAFHTSHAALYAVLMASSSAALALPAIDSMDLSGDAVAQVIPQLAIADTLCIVALPMAIDPAHVTRAALGSVTVLGTGALIAVLMWHLERSGTRKRVLDYSENHRLAVELRVSTMVLFALCALAAAMHVSVMLAGFVMGLGMAAIGNPRRLGKQLFALTEGFLGPVFFVWLGASLDLRLLGSHPAMLLLGAALAGGALAAHAGCRLTGQPWGAVALASAQLGLPLAALKIGGGLGYFEPGEAGSLVVSAVLTISVAIVASRSLARGGDATTESSPPT